MTSEQKLAEAFSRAADLADANAENTRMNDKKAKPGTLLCVDSGEYSDYSVQGFFVVLQEFSPMEELKQYLSERPTEKKQYGFHGEFFLAMLLRKGLLLEISYSTLYLGTYGNAGDVAFR